MRLLVMGATMFALSTRDPLVGSGASVTIEIAADAFHLFDASGALIPEGQGSARTGAATGALPA